MTDEQIIRTLAEKVMGWEEGILNPGWTMVPMQGWYTPASSFVKSFRPLTHDADACAVLDKLWHPVLEHYNGEWHCRATNVETGIFSHSDKCRRRAICIAALKAVGVWEE